jgi:hypothetical protein
MGNIPFVTVETYSALVVSKMEVPVLDSWNVPFVTVETYSALVVSKMEVPVLGSWISSTNGTTLNSTTDVSSTVVSDVSTSIYDKTVFQSSSTGTSILDTTRAEYVPPVDILLVSLVDTFIVCVFTVDDIVSCVDGIAPCVDIAEFAWPIFLDVNFEIPFVTEYIPGLVEDVEISFVSKVAVFATVKLCNEDVDAICSFPFKEYHPQ